MRIHIVHKSKQRGSALLTTLFICTLLALGLAGYLSLVTQQNVLSARSQTWNLAMAIVEAGVEDGLQQYNLNKDHLAGLQSNGYNPGTNANTYVKTQTLDDGNSYTVTIDVSNWQQPLVTSVASVKLPTFVGQFYGAALLTTPGTYVVRAVQVQCSQTHNYNATMIVKNNINMNGNGVMTDSYDSGDPTKSSNGLYCSSIYSGDYGDIATDGGIVNGANGNVYGKVHTGTGGQVGFGPNGAVGSHAWQSVNVVGMEPGWVLNDANFTWPNITVPPQPYAANPMGKSEVTYTCSNAVTVSNFPTNLPSGSVVWTNFCMASTTNLPSPVPQGVQTNPVPDWFTVANLPSPVPSGTITNPITTPTTTTSYPSDPTTYVGGVTTNHQGNGNSKVISGYSYNKITSYTYTVPVYTYTYPYNSYTYSTNVIWATNAYNMVLLPGNTYSMPSVPAGYKVFVEASSPPTNATLILTGGLTGSENFTIGRGARLTIYSENNITMNGSGINNPNGYAGSFIVLGTTNCTSLRFSGNGTFIGVVVAPYAVSTISGGGNNNTDFCGCLMGNSLTFNGHFSFHYDEALGKDPANGRFIINAWNEINPNQ